MTHAGISAKYRRVLVNPSDSVHVLVVHQQQLSAQSDLSQILFRCRKRAECGPSLRFAPMSAMRKDHSFATDAHRWPQFHICKCMRRHSESLTCEVGACPRKRRHIDRAKSYTLHINDSHPKIEFVSHRDK